MYYLCCIFIVLLVLISVFVSGCVVVGECSLDGVNFIGLLIIFNLVGLLQGNWYIEFYLVWVDSCDYYDDGGYCCCSGQCSGVWVMVVLIIYGFSDWVMGQVNFSVLCVEQGSVCSSGFCVGDIIVCLQYLLQVFNVDGMCLVILVVLVQCFSIGSYDCIISNLFDVQGDGVQCIIVVLGMQQVVWLGNDCLLCWCVQFSVGLVLLCMVIFGVSVYGIDDSFQGYIFRGLVLGLLVGVEYSFNLCWVGVMEVVVSCEIGQCLSGFLCNVSGVFECIDEYCLVSCSVILVLVVEYYFSLMLGLIVGVEFSVVGCNIS